MIDVLETAPLFVMRLDVGYPRAVHLGSPFEQGRSVFRWKVATLSAIA